ncbi:very short patch repair endonuclease [Elioraea sp.]|jgi:DNA mismatch endonuclease (patch repair protein)|uniref:very short patch repair endonuclease n=1 Tax=Elioraea sp. TaxID=2185103 RepID=UPI0035B5A5E3
MTTVATRRRMQATKGRDNAAELSLRSALHRLGLRFNVHRRILEGSSRTADIVFVRHRVAVFVDGCFWHGCPIHMTWPKSNSEWWRAKIGTNKRRDADTDLRLAAAMWTVVRVWEHEPADAAARRVAEILRMAERKNKKTNL